MKSILEQNGITTAKKLQNKVNKYLKEHEQEMIKDENGKPLLNRFGQLVYKLDPPTITGLAIFLGYSTPDSFKNPEGIFKKNTEYGDIIQQAKCQIGNILNVAGLTGVLNPRLVERNLACNYGMTETKHVKLDAKIKTMSDATGSILDDFEDDSDQTED